MSIDLEIEAATERLKNHRKQFWQEIFAGIPEVQRGPVKSRKRPEPFERHVPVRKELRYVERIRC